MVPESFTQEERSTVVRILADQAEETFQREYFKINEWFQQYDALYLLSYYCVYFLSHLEGTDPEVVGRPGFSALHIEILQAFSLMQERAVSQKALFQEAPIFLETMETMETMEDAISMRTWKGLVDLPEEEHHQHLVLSIIRTQTAAVRNSEYAEHKSRVAGYQGIREESHGRGTRRDGPRGAVRGRA